MALSASSGLWRLLDPANAEFIPFVNNSGGTLSEGTLVRYSSGTVGACPDSNTIGAHGVVHGGDVANGDRGTLCVKGMFEVGVNGSINFAIDDPVYSYTGGLVDEGTANDIPVGRIAPYEDPASAASTVKVLLQSLFYETNPTAHA